jgi:hypothetical protein
MRRIKVFSVGFAVIAMLVLLSASGASAAKLLVMTEGEVPTPVAVGAPGDTGLVLGGCIVFTEGTVTVNGAAKDKVTATKNAAAECEEGVSISGVITETVLASSGKASLIGKIALTQPGPCIYEFSKFKAKFSVSSSLFFHGTTSGKLNKASSAKTCAKKASDELFGDVSNEPFGSAFGGELKH